MTQELKPYIQGNLTSISSAPSKAVELVTSRLPELTAKADAFNRNNSQTTLTMMTLTMMTGQSPMRQIRQILAEVEKRQMALAEAQLSHAKLVAKLDKQPKTEVGEAKQRHQQFSLSKLESKIGGAIKDIATLITAYDRLVEKIGCGEWTEEEFELSECKHHIRRGFELLYQDLVEFSRPKKSTIEYLTQFGVHVQLAIREVSGYMQVVENEIKNTKWITASHLEDFLDEMADKYQHCALESAYRMFGVDNIVNPDFMTTWKK